MQVSEKSEISRELILKAAILEFGEYGYEGASMRRICKASGVSNGRLFHHFKDKSELHLASGRSVFEMFAEHIETFNLDKAKFLQMMKDMSGCGDAVVKNSKARGTAYRLGINSDKPDAFVVLFRWLYGEITTRENMTAIKTVIDSTDLNSVVKMLIKTVLNRVAETPTDDALVALVNLAAPKAPEIKIPGEIGDLFPNKDKDDSNKTDNNGGTQQTGDPSIPKTGGSILTICFSLAATAALAGGAMLAKKKSEEE